jgi:hypothetical protein
VKRAGVPAVFSRLKIGSCIIPREKAAKRKKQHKRTSRKPREQREQARNKALPPTAEGRPQVYLIV